MSDHPDLSYDAPHDVGNRYLQWRLHQEKMEPYSDVSELPNCLHCFGNAPCTARVCINCVKTDSDSLN
jgi:hypothetical protein